MTSPQYLRTLDLKDDVPFQASKWLKSPMLIDADEMESLFNAIGSFNIFSTGTVCRIGEGFISREEFLSCYKDYTDALKNGKMPDEARCRAVFSSVITLSTDSLYSLLVGEGKQLVRVAKPIIQVQAHRMDYSKADGKFHSMTFGADNVTWGVQFSYPQLYQDTATKEIHQVGMTPDCPNTALFRDLQLWTRNNTIPTPFIVEGKKLHIPVRLGKKCLSWINNHPQLARKGLVVDVK